MSPPSLPLADRLREEESLLLLGGSCHPSDLARYCDDRGLETEDGKPHQQRQATDSEDKNVPQDANTREPRDSLHLKNRILSSNEVTGLASPMSHTSVSNTSEAHLGSQGNDAPPHQSLLHNDLDMDDSDGGAPLHALIAAATADDNGDNDDGDDDLDDLEEMSDLASTLGDFVSTFGDENDSALDSPTFEAYLENLLGYQPEPGPGPQPESEEEEEEEEDEVPDVAMHIPPPPNPWDPAYSVLPPHPPPPSDHFNFFAQHPPPLLPALDTVIANLAPVQISNPNPFILGSENLGLVDFLRDWAHIGGRGTSANVPGTSTHMRCPDIREVIQQAGTAPDAVTYADLEGNACDFQGLNWTAMGTTREAARRRRRMTYRNHVNCRGSDNLYVSKDQESISSRESFFRFRAMTIRQDVSLAHFQLRSVLACPSATKAYYPSPKGIMCINSFTNKTDIALNMRPFPGISSAITTLDANYGVLLAGTFNGDYVLQSLYTENNREFSDGQIGGINGITNHLQIHMSRNNARPVAAIASNDNMFRLMDIETESFITATSYPFAPNCSALSPDRRLRVVVGDDCDVLITHCETGEVLQRLTGHRDYGFACDWSDDGYTVATGFQDRGIKIWDARRWRNSSGASTPLYTLRTEMSGVRGLRFSPLGSGRNVLVAAEEADVINIIDAQSFCAKQTLEIFGEIGGVAFDNSGQDLNILCCDTNRGGLLQLERCGRGPEPALENNWSQMPTISSRFRDRSMMSSQIRFSIPGHGPAMLHGLEPF